MLVTIDGINFSPDLEAGWFDKGITDPIPGPFGPVGNKVDELIPKLLRFSCTMTVLHKTTIGHQGTKWPDKLGTFPNLPDWEFPESRLPFAGTFGAGGAFSGIEQRSFNEEEEAAAQKAIDNAKAELDSVETSNQRKTREEKKRGRSGNREARKTAREIDAALALAEEALDESRRVTGGSSMTLGSTSINDSEDI